MLEIVEKLYKKPESEPHYGITELYEALLPPKATFSNCRVQILALEIAGCILVEPSKEKASKKSVILSEDFRRQIELDVYG